ncbi:hypothetical protein DFR24_4020 [Panacagrimonas perspica]|uniref:Uncharacterized protein n=1 Tax=Panacagrimonas perspica TaxID=381431 RepID=A0A4R7NXZ0_9GAMM|nr:hypothetical protein [Panacagrimonas perspica]TDU25581.1 hypothetical protein DFR24_4020 [Panacagrimonas perspica]THD03820.1 hypothetical protein B1810_08075 [Panacagrimonas perspica]
MDWILHAAHRAALAPFFFEGTRLLLEYRGALVPAYDPQLGSALPSLSSKTLDLLQRVATHYRVTILAGAERRDVQRRLDSLRSVDVIDNDRMRPEPMDPIRALQTIGDWKKELEERLEGFSSILVRDRLFSIVVDFRSTHSPRLAERAVRRVASQLEHARLSGTNGVLEIQLAGSDHAPSLGRLAEQATRGSTLFVHGTGNQEDRLRLLASPRILPIRVGNDLRSQGFCLREQAEVDALLRMLTEGATAASRKRESGRSASAI